MEIAENIKRTIMYHLPKKWVHNRLYSAWFGGKKINWNNPELYDEWVHYHMVHTYNSTYKMYADKYAVRKYVGECGYGQYLIPLYNVYQNISEMDFDELPENCVLKMNHASGTEFYEICQADKALDRNKIIEKFDKAFQYNYAYKHYEYHYRKIKPLLLCEKLLKQKGQERLTDYKVVCAYDKPIAILVCSNRDEGRDYYSIKWEYLEYTKEEYRSKYLCEKPECLDEMLEVASQLAKPFPLSRIDFYLVDGKLYFGEITLTPSTGNHQNLTEFGQKELGKAFSK